MLDMTRLAEEIAKRKQISTEEFLDEFEQTVKQMVDTCRRKNADYAGDNVDPFFNIKFVEKMEVVPAEAGIMVRLSDKWSRILSFMEKGTLQVKDESIQDTCIDAAVYFIMLKILIGAKSG